MKSRILTVEDLPNLEVLFDRADRYQKQTEIKPWTLHEAQWQTMAHGKFLGCIFGEPSIRTRWSFEVAFQKLGGIVISSFGPGSTSEEKGEFLSDMLKVASLMTDFIVIRQNQPLNRVDLSHIDAHIINAGDGNNEHPTQALLDAYTIWREFKRLDNLKIFVAGDLYQSRTIHSLLKLLGDPKYNNYFYLCDSMSGCPDAREWTPSNSEMVETYNVPVCLPNVDVVYLNRVQWERRSNDELDEFWGFDTRHMQVLNKNAIVMNPGPRREEMPAHVVDNDPRNRFWDQVKNGLYIRMALFHQILREAG